MRLYIGYRIIPFKLSDAKMPLLSREQCSQQIVPAVLTRKKVLSATKQPGLWNKVADMGSDIAPTCFGGFAITRTVPRPVISGPSDFETELLGTGSKIDSLGAPPHRAPRGACYPSEVRDFSTARRMYF